MAANNDFFLNFGSNAPTFVTDLKRDLGPAEEYIKSLGRLLQGLEQQSAKSVPAITKNMGGVPGAGAPDVQKIADAASDFSTELKRLKTEIQGVVGALALAVGKGKKTAPDGTETTGGPNLVQAQLSRERRRVAQLQRTDQWRDPATGRPVTAGTPGAVPFRASATAPRTGANTVTVRAPQPPPSIRDVNTQSIQVSSAQIQGDFDGGFNRVVNALNEVRDEVRHLREAGGLIAREGMPTRAPAAQDESRIDPALQQQIEAAEKRLATADSKLAAAREKAAVSTTKSGLSDEQRARAQASIDEASRDLADAKARQMASGPSLADFGLSKKDTKVVNELMATARADKAANGDSDEAAVKRATELMIGLLTRLEGNMSKGNSEEEATALHRQLVAEIEGRGGGGDSAEVIRLEEELAGRKAALAKLEEQGTVTNTKASKKAADEMARLEREAKEAAAELSRLRETAAAQTSAPAAPAPTRGSAAYENRLRQTVNETESELRTLRAIEKQAGHLFTDEMGERVKDLQQQNSDARRELAAVQRERGVAKKQRQSEHRTAADEGRTKERMSDDEWDRRNRIRRNLEMVDNPEVFRAATRTKGAGALLIDGPGGLKELAKTLTDLGYATRRSGTKEQLTEAIIASRTAMKAEYGNQIPKELLLGERVPSDKLSGGIEELVRRLNLQPEQRAADAEAVQAFRMAGLTGVKPKDPTFGGGESIGGKIAMLENVDLPSLGFAMSTEMQTVVDVMHMLGGAGRDLSEMWKSAGTAMKVPSGMVKGGDYDDDALSQPGYRPYAGDRRQYERLPGQRTSAYPLGAGARATVPFMAAQNPANNIGPSAAMGFQAAQKYFDAEWIKRAIPMMGDRNLDLRGEDFDFNSQIKGTGETANDARRAFLGLKRAIDTIDQLAEGYFVLAGRGDAESEMLRRGAYGENEAFIRRAEGRRMDGMEKPTDEVRLAEAYQFRDRMEQDLQRIGPQLAQLFSSSDFMEAFDKRSSSRALEVQTRAESDIENFANPRGHRDFTTQSGAASGYYGVDIRDALSRALVNTRLAQGTKDTYVSNLPGATVNRNGDIAWMNPDGRDQGAMKGLNEVRRKFEIQLGRFAEAVEDELDEEEIAKEAAILENRATKFLNRIQDIFKVSPDIRMLLPEGIDISEAGMLANDKRQQVANATRADALPRATTDEEKATARLAEVKHKLAKALAKQEQKTNELTKLEDELGAQYEALGDAEKQQFLEATNALKPLLQQRAALRNIALIEDPAARRPRTETEQTSGAIAKNNEYLAFEQAKLAALRRNESAQRGALTRAERSGDGQRIEKAQGKLAEVRQLLGAQEQTVEQLTRLVPQWNEAARVARESGKNTYDRFLSDDGMHLVGEKLRAAPAEYLQRARIDEEADELTRRKQALEDPNRELNEVDKKVLAETRARLAVLAKERVELQKVIDTYPDLADEIKRLDTAIEQSRASRAAVAGGDPNERGRLVQELEERKARRTELSRMIGDAASEGDLKENAGYHEAKDEQGRNEARIKQLEAKLTETGVEKYEALETELGLLAQEIDHLTASLDKAEKQVSATARAVATPAATAGGYSQGEISDMKKRLDRAQELAGQLKKAREAVDKAKESGDVKAIKKAQAERDAIKQQEGFLGVTDRRALRREYFDATNGGQKPPTGGGGAAGGSAPDGGDPGDSNILRQILAAINKVDASIKSGLKITSGKVTIDEKGQATIEAKPRKRRELADGEVRRAPGETREMAEARAATQREAALLRQGKREEQLNNAREQKSRRLAKADMEQAQAKVRLAAATAQLNDAARAELALLDAMIQKGEDAEAIAMQQAKALHTVEDALRRSNPNSTSTQRQALGREVMGASGGEYAAMRTTATAMFGDSLGRAGEDGRDQLAHALFGDKGFWGRIMGSTGAFIVRNFTAGFVFGLTNALQEVVMQGILTEATWIRVSDALHQTGREAGGLRTDLQAISADYGVALNDVYMTAAGLTGVFEDVGDIASATRVVAQLQAISMGALNAQEAMGVLSSITGAYRNELSQGADGLEQVADVLTVVQNTIGTNVETTAEGVGALSGLAQRLKIPFEEMSVYVAQIAKMTNQTGAAAGENFSRILASMQTGRGRAALTEALPDSGIDQLLGSGEYGQAIQVLMERWDGLSESQQNNLAVTIAGQRQARAFAALMSDTEKTLDATARAHDANGQAAARAAQIAHTLNGLLARLNANFQNLAQNLVRTGILNFFGILLGVLNQVLEFTNRIFSEINDFADGSAFGDMLRDWTFGLLGFVAAWKVVGMAVRGFRGSLEAMKGSDGVLASGMSSALGQRDDDKNQGLRGQMAAGGATMYGRTAAWRDDVRARRQVIADAGVKQPRISAIALAGQEKAAMAATRATAGLSKGLGVFAGMGLGAMAVLTGVTFALGSLYQQYQAGKAFEKRVAELNEEYDPETGAKKTEEEKKREYVGPFDDAMREEQERRQGGQARFWHSFKQFYTSNPFTTSRDDLTQEREEWEEGFNEAVQEQVDAAKKEVQAIMGALDGADGLADGKRDVYEFKDGGWQIKDAKKFTEGEAMEATEKARAVLVEKRKALYDQLQSGDIDEQEYANARAQIEAQDKALNEWSAAQLMKARGFAAKDNLSSDLLKNIDELRPLLQQIQGMGLDDATMNALNSLVEDTGVPEDSKAGQIIKRLSEGNLSRAEALREERSLIEIELANAQAKFDSYTAGDIQLEPEEVEELGSQIQGYIQQLASKTSEIIAAFVQSSTDIANAAVNNGQYAQAEQALKNALAGIGAELAKPGLSDEVRAQLELQQDQVASQLAQTGADRLNEPLRMQQAWQKDPLEDQRLETQMAENTYRQLAATPDAPVKALKDAKIAWINAERQLASMASQVNIASLTAQAAGIWNGLASAQMQEQIAMAQYNAAVAEFGAGSVQALQAQAAITQAQHTTITTQDQITAATNEATLASIPQGNAVAVAQQGVRNAQAALAAAEKYGHNSTEYQNALAQLYSAQQGVNGALAAQASAQVGVAIAVAEAAGNTVLAAQLQLKAARIALASALKNSGGANSAEVLQARASVISAQAAVRDARLQDELDTIDFNLQMGRITQSSAITALREILRTSDLTKQQRRQLLLQIKGMQEELSGSPWNFGDIKPPKPYLMRRYIEENRKANTARMDRMVGDSISASDAASGGMRGGGIGQQYNDHRVVTIKIDGGDEARVRRIVRQEVGTPGRTRTTQPRRGRR